MHYTQATQRNAYNVRSTLTVLSVNVSLENKQSEYRTVRMAERSKALRSGRSPVFWARVRIPLLTFLAMMKIERRNRQA